MDAQELAPQDRRTFLGKVGKTLAVGLGLGLMTSAGASATTDVCGIWCTDQGPGSCCPGCHNFHCVSGPCGYEYDDCNSHTSSYCACNGCC
jgi:hypothetical protein